MRSKAILRFTVLFLLASVIAFSPAPKVAAEGDGTNGKTFYEYIADESVADNIASEYVISDTGIDFSQPTVDTEGNYVNGNGIYQMSATTNEENPVYYYRGNPDNNNIIFNGFCWLAMHTTETGGVKLIYNGQPGENGACGKSAASNSGEPELMTGCMYSGNYVVQDVYGDCPAPNTAVALTSFGKSGSTIGESYVYDTADQKTYSPPMTQFGHLVEPDVEPTVWQFYFSDSVEYSNGKYTLINPVSYDEGASKNEIEEVTDGHRYTCMSEGALECEKVYYILHLPSANFGNADAVVLEGGQIIDDVSARQTSKQDSIVKLAVDGWFEEKMTDESRNQLEDTTFCNERNLLINSFDMPLLSQLNIQSAAATIMASPNTISSTGAGVTGCSSDADALSVNNGELRYPIALPSVSELILSGVSTARTDNLAQQSTFLSDSEIWWTMDSQKIAEYVFASNHSRTVSAAKYVFYRGTIKTLWTSTKAAVRPVISLKNTIGFTGGDGSSANPFTGAYEPPRITDGEDQTYEVDNISPVIVKANGSIAKFNSIQVDGQTVSPDNYAISSEDTTVALSSDYMNTLSRGAHTATYQFLEGADQTYEITNDGSSVTLRADGDISKFVRLLIDGEEVDPENYDLSSGSTVVTLSPAYLATLADGPHTITFVYEDGEASTGLTITRAAATVNPNTIDILTIVAITLAAAAAAFTIVGRRAATRRR